MPVADGDGWVAVYAGTSLAGTAADCTAVLPVPVSGKMKDEYEAFGPVAVPREEGELCQCLGRNKKFDFSSISANVVAFESSFLCFFFHMNLCCLQLLAVRSADARGPLAYLSRTTPLGACLRLRPRHACDALKR